MTIFRLDTFARNIELKETRNGNGGETIARKQSPPAQRIRSFIDLWLGEQLRMRRKALGKSLQEVALAGDISVSLLSQIERGLRSVSVQTLNSLAVELKTPVEDFLINLNVDNDLDEEHATAVVRAGHHRRIDPAMHTGIHKEVLTPPLMADGNLQLYKALIEPGGSTGETFFTTFTGYQIGYVIEGTLELHVGKKLLRLKKGDSFCYENQMPRRWCNPGTTNTVVLWAVTLPASETQKRRPKTPKR